MKEKKPLPKSFYSHTPWDENTSALWPATSFYLHRNFKGNLFPSKMSEPQAVKLTELLAQVMLGMQQLQNPICLKAEEVTPLEKEFLYEHFLCRETFQNTLKGQAFIIDDTAHFLAILNVTDHLQMELIDCKNKWEKAWSILSDIDTAVGSSIEQSFSSKFGYLTSDPGKCGTGLSVMCYLHLPLLIQSGQLNDTLDTQLEESVMATSLQGAPGEYVGDFVLLQNKFTLGLTEEMILRDLHISATKLTLSEQTLRDKCKTNPDLKIKDLVSRSYGLLIHSFQLQTKEVLDALSKVKLGIDLGWITGLTDSKINEIFFTCQRAHIGFVFGETGSDPQIVSAKRAEFIHNELKNSKFVE